MDGVELGLFADGARDLAPAMGSFDERLELTLTFEHQGGLYRVRRSYVAAGKGRATLDFEQRVGVMHHTVDDVHTWVPLTRESTSATQELICATIGLSRTLFNASAFLAQGNAGAWLKASPAEKKALLGEMLDFAKMWPGFAAKAATERKQVEAELAGAQGRMADRAELAEQRDDLAATVAGKRDWHAHQAAQAKNADLLLEEALAALAASEAATERLRAATQAKLEAENRRDNARDVYQAARERAEQLPHAQAALAQLAATSAQMPELERKAEAQSKTLAEAALAQERKQTADRHAAQLAAEARKAHEVAQRYALERETLEGQIAHLEDAADGSERCTLCAQTLGAEARAATLANLDDRLIAVNVAIAEHAPEVGKAEWAAREAGQVADAIQAPEVSREDFSGPLAQARKAGEQRAALEVAIQGYEQAAGELPALKEALEQAEAHLTERAAVSARVAAEQQGGPALAQAAAGARAAQQAARKALDEAQAELVRAQEALARAEQAATELAALRAQAAEGNARLDLLRLAERACGRDGIPALIAENTCGQIEAEANRVLERLPTASGTTFRVELRTQRALKGDASALRETLDILVSDRQQQREYLTFSGGEKWRVSFALRWALVRLLAGRRGAESRLLVIDEPDGLDAGGMDGLATVLREEQGGFEKILLVSHSPLLAAAFEQVVEVESDGEVSHLIAAPIEEALV